MVERINLLLKAKNVTARQFAEEIGIQPSGMSHILSGRNNPSLDFVMKVVRRWPEININWLMFGQGEMYAGMPPQVAAPAPAVSSQVTDQGSQSTFHTSPAAYDEPDLFSQPAVAEPSVTAKPVVPRPTPAKPDENHVNGSAKAVHPVQPIVADLPGEHDLRVAEAVVVEPEVQGARPTPRKVVKVVYFYDDKTFEEFFPG